MHRQGGPSARHKYRLRRQHTNARIPGLCTNIRDVVRAAMTEMYAALFTGTLPPHPPFRPKLDNIGMLMGRRFTKRMKVSRYEFDTLSGNALKSTACWHIRAKLSGVGRLRHVGLFSNSAPLLLFCNKFLYSSGERKSIRAQLEMP